MIAAPADILITAELVRRPARKPDYEAENRALAALVEAMAVSPQTILQTLAETALQLCRADSAGISILEPGAGGGTFRWHGIAGQFAGHVGRGLQRRASPCGLVLDSDTSLLFAYPERHFEYGAAVDPPMVEALLVPFHLAGKPVGTVWVIAHTSLRQFDREDQRLLTSLSRFAAAAHQMKTIAGGAVEAKEEVRQILDTAATGIVRCSRDLRYISANAAYARLAGVPIDRIVGRPIVDVVGVKAFEVIRPYIERVLRGERVEYEDRVPYLGGLTRFLHGVGTPWIEGDGTVSGFVASISDITELKSTAVALQQGQQQLRIAHNELGAILKAAPIGIVTMDHRGNVVTWNDAAERILGYDAIEIIGRLDPSVPSDAGEQFNQSLANALAGKTIQTRTRRIRKDGSVIQVWCTLAPLYDEHGASWRVISLIEDITEKTNMEVALARARAALAKVQVEEARRVARDLHDDITQRLALISFEIDRIVSGPPRSRDDLLANVRTFREKIHDLSDGVREISHRMHPSVVEHLGLAKALEYLCADVSEREGIPVHFQSSGLTPEMPPVIAYSLYRVVQEALHNISKHAKAIYAEVNLARTGQIVQLSITDTGIGFDAAGEKSGFGLVSMRERIELLNGTLSIKSEPGCGTRIVATVPMT